MIALLPWGKIAAVVALLVVLAGGAWKVRHGGIVEGRAEVQMKWDKERAETTAAALVASEAARAKEQVLTTANAKVTNDYLTQKKLRAADAVAADGKLRELQAALSSPSGTDTAPLGGADDPRDTIIDQCATVVLKLDEYAKGVALKAIGLQSYASQVCMK